MERMINNWMYPYSSRSGGDVGIDYVSYRGYEIDDLATHCTFEEVAHLLIHGHLPNTKELEAYIQLLASMRDLPGALKDVLERIPSHAHPMDVVRSGVSILGILEPESPNNDQFRVVDRLIASYASILLYWYHWTRSGKRINTVTKKDDCTTVHFLKLLHNTDQEPNPLHVRVLDVLLILYADHDMAASSFAASITTSTMSDIYSAILSGIASLRGPLHGGANMATLQLLGQFKSPDEAEKGVRTLIAKKELVIEQRGYKKGEPRNAIIKNWSKKLSQEHDGDPNIFAISERIEQLVFNEKKMYPNLDYYSAFAYHQIGIPASFITPVFVISRTTGWAAHIFAQRQNNNLIRPSAVYVDPPPKFVTIDKRARL